MKKYLYLIILLLGYQSIFAQENPRYQIGLNVFQIVHPLGNIETERSTFHQLIPQLYGKFQLGKYSNIRTSIGYQILNDTLDFNKIPCCSGIHGKYQGLNITFGIERYWDLGKFRPVAFVESDFKRGTYKGSRHRGVFPFTRTYNNIIFSVGLNYGIGFDFYLTKQLGIGLTTAFSTFYHDNQIHTIAPLSSGESSDIGFTTSWNPIQQLGVFWAF